MTFWKDGFDTMLDNHLLQKLMLSEKASTMYIKLINTYNGRINILFTR